jgi:hypothetical protein
VVRTETHECLVGRIAGQEECESIAGHLAFVAPVSRAVLWKRDPSNQFSEGALVVRLICRPSEFLSWWTLPRQRSWRQNDDPMVLWAGTHNKKTRVVQEVGRKHTWNSFLDRPNPPAKVSLCALVNDRVPAPGVDTCVRLFNAGMVLLLRTRYIHPLTRFHRRTLNRRPQARLVLRWAGRGSCARQGRFGESNINVLSF